MKIKLPSIDYIYKEASATLRRFPSVLFVSMLACALFIWQVDKTEHTPDLALALFTAALGIPLMFAVSLFCEGRLGRTRQMGYGLACLVLLAYFFLNRHRDPFVENFYIRYFQLNFACHLLVAFAGFIGNGNVEDFWQFNRSLFTRFLISILYAFVIFVGLAITIYTVDLLFQTKWAEYWVLRIWAVTTFVVQTWFFLAGVPSIAAGFGRDYPKGIKIFTQYTLVPLITLYGFILYLYTGKILLTWNWPHGQIAWFIAGMSISGIYALLLLFPVSNNSENAWIRWFSRVFYIAILPLMVVMLIAVTQRLAQHGFTEKRYFLIVLSLWLAGISFYFIRHRNGNIKWIPSSLCVMALVTSFGPWSAYSVSLRDQMGRIEKLLQKGGLLKDGQILRADNNTLSFEDRRDLSGALEYIIKDQGSEYLAKWFPEDKVDPEKTDKYNLPQDLMRYLGQNYVSYWDTTDREDFYLYTKDYNADPTSISGFDDMVPFYLGSTFKYQRKKWTVSADKETASISIKAEDQTSLEIPLKEVIDQIVKSHLSSDFPFGSLFIEGESSAFKFRLIVQDISGRRQKDRPSQIDNLKGLLLLKKK